MQRKLSNLLNTNVATLFMKLDALENYNLLFLSNSVFSFVALKCHSSHYLTKISENVATGINSHRYFKCKGSTTQIPDGQFWDKPLPKLISDMK